MGMQSGAENPHICCGTKDHYNSPSVSVSFGGVGHSEDSIDDLFEKIKIKPCVTEDIGYGCILKSNSPAFYEDCCTNIVNKPSHIPSWPPNDGFVLATTAGMLIVSMILNLILLCYVLAMLHSVHKRRKKVKKSEETLILLKYRLHMMQHLQSATNDLFGNLPNRARTNSLQPIKSKNVSVPRVSQRKMSQQVMQSEGSESDDIPIQREKKTERETEYGHTTCLYKRPCVLPVSLSSWKEMILKGNGRSSHQFDYSIYTKYSRSEREQQQREGEEEEEEEKEEEGPGGSVNQCSLSLCRESPFDYEASTTLLSLNRAKKQTRGQVYDRFSSSSSREGDSDGGGNEDNHLSGEVRRRGELSGIPRIRLNPPTWMVEEVF